MKFRYYALKLCLIMMLVFILQVLFLDFADLFVLNQLAFAEVWRFFTAIFLHGSFIHLIYTSIGALAGMKNLYEEGKTMGLAPYGKPSEFLDFFKKYAFSNSDGSYFIDPRLIYAALGNTLGPKFYGWKEQPNHVQEVWKEFMKIRGRPIRKEQEHVTQEDMDISYAGQIILEKILLGLAKRARKITGCENLCLAGGVALNSVANTKIINSKIFRKIYIFPAAGDDGQAIGKLFYQIKSNNIDVNLKAKTAYYGPQYTKKEIDQAIKKFEKEIEIISINAEKTIKEVVDRIINGQVIGWYRGRSEIGPRALGHRSILADPREKNIRDYINFTIKYREWYRPLAPTILEERVSEFFDTDKHSPFMLFTTDILNSKRNLIPAVEHIDGSARIQTINEEQDAYFYKLIKKFGNKTGIPVLLNTSFNQKNEPMVETPEDAIKAFLKINLEALVLEDNLIIKKFH